MMELSKRLQAVASMVEKGSVVADVGCDHGYVAIWLVQNGICPRVLAMDVNKGPLMRAKEHVEAAGLASYIELRLSDGLEALRMTEYETDAPPAGAGQVRRLRGAECAAGCGEPHQSGVSGGGALYVPEADTLLTAGLGGRLASRILEDGAEKLAGMKWAILQPQSELWLVRQTLRKLGYFITDENMILEDGKFYTVMKAVNGRRRAPEERRQELPGGMTAPVPAGWDITPEWWQEAADRYGPCLLEGCHPVLMDFLERSLRKNKAILEKAGAAASEGGREKLRELDAENARMEKLLSIMRGIMAEEKSGM